MKRKWLTVAFLFLVVVATLIGATTAALLWLARQAPDFYVQARIEDPERLEQLADQVVRRWSQAANALQQPNQPVVIELTDEEINAWLQRDLMGRVRALVPELTEAPRIQLDGSKFRFGVATDVGGTRAVLAFEGQLWLAPDGRLAVRLEDVRLGAAPVPAQLVARWLARELERADFAVDLREWQGSPVLLFDLEPSPDFALLDVRIHEGRLRIAGRRVDQAASTGDQMNSHVSPSSLLK